MLDGVLEILHDDVGIKGGGGYYCHCPSDSWHVCTLMMRNVGNKVT